LDLRSRRFFKTEIILVQTTYPVYASLDHPLCPLGKEGKKKAPLSAVGEERGDKRSDVGVSKRPIQSPQLLRL